MLYLSTQQLLFVFDEVIGYLMSSQVGSKENIARDVISKSQKGAENKALVREKTMLTEITGGDGGCGSHFPFPVFQMGTSTNEFWPNEEPVQNNATV